MWWLKINGESKWLTISDLIKMLIKQPCCVQMRQQVVNQMVKLLQWHGN